jgi:zinc transport system substrate-binding protein
MNVIDHKQLDKFSLIWPPLFLLAILTFLLSACSYKTKNTKPIISVSILPQKFFVEKITGDHFEINVMIPPGASPATYDPTPSQLIELSDSKTFFKIGHIEFEKNWLDRIVHEYPQLDICDVSSGIDLIENLQYDSNH